MRPWQDGGQPYATSRELRARVADERTLYVYMTADGHGPDGDHTDSDHPGSGDHPMLELSGYSIDGVAFTYNDLFRAVHDLFGHVLQPNAFTIEGELCAVMSHLTMYSVDAGRVVLSETAAQICWYYYGPHLVGSCRRGERPYPPQKVAGHARAPRRRLLADVRFLQPVDRGLRGGGMTILLDGGLATELHHSGIAMEAPLFSAQALVTERGREAVLNCHLEFLAAGAEVIPADTFRTNLRAVREIGGDELLAADLTRTAVDIARGAITLSGAGSAALAAMVAPVAECYDPSAVPNNDALESEHGFFMGLLVGVRGADRADRDDELHPGGGDRDPRRVPVRTDAVGELRLRGRRAVAVRRADR